VPVDDCSAATSAVRSSSPVNRSTAGML
jgi:hypothetical protein